jgi:diguanylate cyclase (GGDEF)-like protein/putative nucleotidyltransferase with HDIG domain
MRDDGCVSALAYFGATAVTGSGPRLKGGCSILRRNTRADRSAWISRETAWLLPLVLPVALAGTIVFLAAAITFARSELRSATLLGLLALLVASVVAEALPVPIEGVYVGAASLATIFLAGSSVIYGWAPAVLLGVATMALVEVQRGRPPLRIAYNTALYALSAAAAGWAGRWFVGIGGIWALLLAASVGALAFYLVDIALLAAVIARSSRERLLPLFGRYVRTTALPFSIMGSVTVLLVEIWDRSAPLAAALAGPLVAIALYQRSVHRALEAMRVARTDPLTGLGNPRAFDERLQQELDAARSAGVPMTLCLIDVDDFKHVNDTYGHAVGDSVLAEVASRLRGGGEAFRLGGDEFALLLPGCDEEEGVEIGQAVIRRVVDARYEAGVTPGISIGITVFPHHAEDRKDLLDLADRALYASKERGKNRVELYRAEVGQLAELRRLSQGPDRAARLNAAAALAHAVDARDTYTGSHSHTVGELAARIAKRMRLDPEQVELARLAGSLHDLGKLAIPEEILQKPGPLNAAERLVLKRHPEIGFRMLDSLGIEPVATWVRHHHERWDGAGYPSGLAGESIPLGARIIFVADAYDAMTSDRTYRSATSHANAFAEIERCAQSQFDPQVVEAFKEEFRGRAVHASA